MNNQQSLPENPEFKARYAFLLATAIAAAHFLAVLYYLYLGQTSGNWQFQALAAISFALGVLIGFGAVLSRRGKTTAGLILALASMAVSYPPVSATLAGGLGLVLGLAVMVIGPMAAFQFLPRRSGRVMTVVTIVSGLATLLLDVFGSAARPSLPGIVIQLLAASVVGVTIFFIVRQFRDYSLRTKLIAAFLAVTIIPIAGLAYYNSIAETQNLTDAATRALTTSAADGVDELDGFIEQALNNVRTDAQLHSLHEYILLPPEERAGSEVEASAKEDLLTISLRDETSITSVSLFDFNGTHLADTVPAEVGEPSSDKIFFTETIKTRSPYVTPVYIEDGALTLSFSAPVSDEAGNLVGVLRVRYKAEVLQQLLIQHVDYFGAEGTFAVLLDENSIRLADTERPDQILQSVAPLSVEKLTQLQADLRLPPGTVEELSTDFSSTQNALQTIDTQPVFSAQFHQGASENEVEKTVGVRLTSQPWVFVFGQNEAVFLAPLQAKTRNSIIIAVVVAALVAALGYLISQLISRPIVSLTTVAQQIAAGEINVQASVESRDEIGVLSKTFNIMTAQLKDTLDGLEKRVAERTSSLVLAAEVGRSVSQVRELHLMLKDSVEIIRSRFDLYYAQVYLTNPAQNALLLQAGTGTVGAELVGRGHQLPLSTASINGRAAIEKRSVVIPDTTASASFKPNPLLPDTRSEMAVPLMLGEKVVGVLDLQSQDPGTLNLDILPAFEALAGQLAIAIQNANLLAETEQARAEVEAQAGRLSRANWVDYLDAIHKPEETGFMFEQNKVMPLPQGEQPQPATDHALTAPIAVTGQALGNLVVEMEGQSPIARTAELVNTVAHQVAQQIENLRLLESAERYRYEAEQAARLQTLEGWQKYIAGRSTENLGYFYDAKEVRPQGDARDEDVSMLVLPLKAREETIGKLSVQGLKYEDQESVELVNAVAERLGAHIEGLRQFEETRRGQIELDKRARQLAAVAEISTVSSKELEIDKMLHSVVHLTQRQFGLYHAHIFIYDENTANVKIAACGWKEGDPNEGTDGDAVIPIDQEQSLVARAFRTRQAVIVNDVHNEPGWLPNPLLPDTASELAVPLVIGDQVLGVLDVQSDRLNAFSEEDANIQTTLATQVATALQNARSFARAQKQAKQESMLNAISQKIQTATTVEAVLQIAARELGHALGAPLTIAQLGVKANGNGNG